MSQSDIRRGSALNNEGMSRRGNYLLINMKNNIKELNRSMSSIEKMIQESRKIIKMSRQNSIQKYGSVEKKGNSPYKQGKIRRQQEYQTGKTSKKYSSNSQNHTISIANRYQPGKSTNRSTNSHKNSNFSFGFSSKFNMGNSQRNKYQINLKKFQPNNVKKEIQMRRSGVRDKMSDSKNQGQCSRVDNSEVCMNSPKQSIKQTPSNRNQESNTKIKIKATPRTTAQKPSQYQKSQPATQPRLESSSAAMIKIEDDEDEEQQQQQQTKNIKQETFQDLKVRFKTDYIINKDDSQEQEQSVVKRFQFSSPIIDSKRGTHRGQINKANLKLFQDKISAKEQSVQSIFSYRDQAKKSKIQIITSTPRQKKQILVNQLHKLQTHSQTQQQRKAKFILKIRKYGFVQKYLTQSQIWSTYDHLIWTGVPELKWPIYIVDQVYKKMKMIQ